MLRKNEKQKSNAILFSPAEHLLRDHTEHLNQ